MNQLKLFDNCYSESTEADRKKNQVHLYIDGAARNNPGKAGAGVYLFSDEKVLVSQGFYLGIKTNNQAEYFALLLGIFFAQKFLGADDALYIFSDSQLLVRQITGQYKIKNIELKKIHTIINSLLKNFDYHICHILRDKNEKADALANIGIDKRIEVPREFSLFLRTYDITL